MQVPIFTPESTDDYVRDVAEGSTFYLDADKHPKHAGQPFMRTGNGYPHPSGALVRCVRMKDGHLLDLGLDEPCKVVALVAEVSGESW